MIEVETPLSIEEAAEAMNLGKRTVERLIASGDLVSIKARGRRMVMPSAINRYLAGPAARRGRVA